MATHERLLDAAVEELVEKGYFRFTTPAVAARARVSRGGQQHHFPHRITLVAAAVRRLADRAMDQLREAAAAGRSGPARTRRVLDLVFDLYRGPLFACMIDLSLAARGDPELGRVIGEVEREISDRMAGWARELILDSDGGDRNREDLEHRLAMSLASARGVALLRLFGHPDAAVERQWRFTRAELVRLLTEAAQALPPPRD